MGGFSVIPTSLDSASSELDSVRATIDSARGGLVDDGGAGASTGSLEASAAFGGMVSAWADALNRLSRSLDAFAQNTAAAAAVYEQTDLEAVPEPSESEPMPPACPEEEDPLQGLLGPDCVVYG